MFKTLLKNKKAQNTAEYALLIALVVAGVIAMQTYAQRALQARVRDAGLFLTSQTNTLGTTNQYEPYYLSSNYAVDRVSTETTTLNNSVIGGEQKLTGNTRGRNSGGFQQSKYNTALGVVSGI